MVYARIAALLKEKMGLDAESIGVASVERAVRERLVARGLNDPQAYWEQLVTFEQELQELIEAVVIPETWFFRDPEAFAALVRVVREEWLAKHAEDVLRILSLPCSTGEEPFSMAMALLDGGLPPPRFHIDAIDISTRAIAWAEQGVYGKNSFRAKDLGFRDRYFEPVERGYRLNDGVRRQVHFRHGNLLSAGWLHGAHRYDAIFCRNVLIYFDRATQCRAIEVLGRITHPSGGIVQQPDEMIRFGRRGLAAQALFAALQCLFQPALVCKMAGLLDPMFRRGRGMDRRRRLGLRLEAVRRLARLPCGRLRHEDGGRFFGRGPRLRPRTAGLAKRERERDAGRNESVIQQQSRLRRTYE